MFLNNKYSKWYFDIIARAKTRTITDSSELHHIIPNSFYVTPSGRSKPGWLTGNPNDAENLVLLTVREHRLCHLLLPRMTTGLAKRKMTLAAKLILETRETRYGLSKGKAYEKIKLEWTSFSNARNVSEETRKKISNALKGRKHTQQHIENNRNSQLKRPPCLPETREKLRNAMLGRKFTEEWREKMSISRNKRPPISEETRLKLKIAAKNRSPQSEETKRKRAESRRGKQHSLETKEKIREAALNRSRKNIIE